MPAFSDHLPPPENVTALHDRAPSNQEEMSGAVGFSGKYGVIKTNIVTTYAFVGMSMGGPSSPDGRLFLQNAVPIADAWIAWGKADPQYMRVVKILWGGPFTTLLIGHAGLAGGLMANHGIKVGNLLRPAALIDTMRTRAASRSSHADASGSSLTQAPSVSSAPDYPQGYTPGGAFAPTEDAGPTPTQHTTAFPDVDLPSDVEIQLRQIARTTNTPYAELREKTLAQYRFALENEKRGATRGTGLGAVQ